MEAEAEAGDPLAQYLQSLRAAMKGQDYYSPLKPKDSNEPKLHEQNNKHDKNAKDDKNSKLFWLKRSAENGLALAQNELGNAYREGLLGMQTSFTEAAKWLTMSSVYNADALNNLGLLLLFSDASRSKAGEAVSYFKNGALMGSTAAMENLAIAYVKGSGVAKIDLDEAIYWFEMCGTGDSLYNIARLHTSREDDEKARSYMVRASNGGHVQASVALAEQLLASEGPKRFLEAAVFLKRAVRGGDGYSAFTLARLHLDGKLCTDIRHDGNSDTSQDTDREQHQKRQEYEKAKGLLHLAASRGVSEAAQFIQYLQVPTVDSSHTKVREDL